MKRLILLLSTTIALSVAFAGPASAFIQDLELDSKATLSATKTSATVTGSISCTAFDTARITAVIIQTSGQKETAGQGQVEVICAGVVQAFSVTVSVLFGTAYKKGPATVLVAATDEDSQFPTFADEIKIS